MVIRLKEESIGRLTHKYVDVYLSFLYPLIINLLKKKKAMHMYTFMCVQYILYIDRPVITKTTR